MKRVCAEEDCITVLSSWNQGDTCWLHSYSHPPQIGREHKRCPECGRSNRRRERLCEHCENFLNRFPTCQEQRVARA